MAYNRFAGVFAFILLFFSLVHSVIDDPNSLCDDFCLGRNMYVNGNYSMDSAQCSYEVKYCDMGCNYDKNECSDVGIICGQYCENGTLNYEGTPVGDWCSFRTITCKNGCDVNRRECLKCEDHCDGKVFYKAEPAFGYCNFRGSLCKFECNEEGTNCSDKPLVKKRQIKLEDFTKFATPDVFLFLIAIAAISYSIYYFMKKRKDIG